jgi:hypothetical protein
MTTANEKDLKNIIAELEQFRKDVYDYDYDKETLWYIDNAIQSLKNI